ncbi:hypothetical protein [Nocardia sp. NPDC004860]|uniref:hypothetical protein n=1 Tax=Nocardia sp. NPDC004860 TaxID=3154557 RepID=UPI0033A4ED4A
MGHMAFDDLQAEIRAERERDRRAAQVEADVAAGRQAREEQIWLDSLAALDVAARDIARICRKVGCPADIRGWLGLRSGWVFDIPTPARRITVLVWRGGSWERVSGSKFASTDPAQILRRGEVVRLSEPLTVEMVCEVVEPQIKQRALGEAYSWHYIDTSR